MANVLLLSLTWSLIFCFSNTLRQFAIEHEEAVFISAAIAVITLFPMFYIQSLKTRIRFHYILLTLFTICKSIVTGLSAVTNRPDLTQIAVLILACSFFGLFCFNCQTGRRSTVLIELSFVITLDSITIISLAFFNVNAITDLITTGISTLLLALVSCLNKFI